MKKLNKSNKITLGIFMISILLIASCKVDKIKPVSESPKDLTGSWKIVSATRNGSDLISLVDSNFVNFNKFRINFKDGSYTLDNKLPFVVTENGTYSLDDPQYPFKITFTATGATPVANAFVYPIVNGKRVLTLTFSAGCSQTVYSYSLQKVN